MRHTISIILFVLITSSPALCAKPDTITTPGVIHRIVAYVPNRILDVLDLVRLRARIGPGFALGIRATEAGDVFVGSYLSVYAGLPGPRCRRIPRLPIGIESNSGVEVSVADATTGLGFSPNYSPTEFGFGFQTLLIGVDLGIDPFELLDLIAGVFFIDLREDDL